MIKKENINLGNLSAGHFEVILAETAEQKLAAQKLRYRVFADEIGARTSIFNSAAGTQKDELDDIADIIIVRDTRQVDFERSVVGTYRVITRHDAFEYGHFPSEDYFDISRIMRYPGNVAELTRACFDKDYRSSPVISLLWAGIASCIYQREVGLIFGTPSLPDADTQKWSSTIKGLLGSDRVLPASMHSECKQNVYSHIESIPDIERKDLWDNLPAHFKGYMRLGFAFGQGAYVDIGFNTIDMFIAGVVKDLNPRYYQHYAERINRALNIPNCSTKIENDYVDTPWIGPPQIS